MWPVGGGPIKIGTSTKVESRHRELECWYGCELEILATMEGGKKEEKEIHRRFHHLRIGKTEQFRPGPDLMNFLGRPFLVGANPEAVEAMCGPLGDTKPVRLDLSPEVHQMLRVVAAEHSKPMAVFARELVEHAVRTLWCKT
jgi:hypothetical protein